MKTLNYYINEALIKKDTKIRIHNYQPKDQYELRDLLEQLLKERGKDADLNDIDVSNITSMAYGINTDRRGLFNGLDPHNIDISEWDVSNVKNMRYMFNKCINYNCDLSKWDVSNVENMSRTFLRCEKFTGKGLSKWNIQNVENINGMFCRCESFDGKEIENWNINNGKIKSLNSTFKRCIIFNADLSNWDVSNIEEMENTFEKCKSFEGKGLEKWNTENLEDLWEMFMDCEKLQADLSNWSTKKIKDISCTFEGCKKLNCDFNKWEINKKTTDIYSTFDGCISLKNIPNWYEV